MYLPPFPRPVPATGVRAHRELDGEAFQDIAILVEALLNKPSLASYPRTLWLSAWDCNEDDGNDVPDSLAEEDLHWCNLSLVYAKVRETARSENQANIWIRQIKQHNNDAWLALLLVLLPNLTRMEVQFPPGAEHFLRVIQGASQGGFNTPVLPSLREVYVTGRWYEFQGDSSTFLVVPFLGLPSLRRLTTDAIMDDQYPMQIGPSPVTHLELHN